MNHKFSASRLRVAGVQVLVAAASLLAGNSSLASQVSVSAELTRLTMGGFYDGPNTFSNGLEVNGQLVDVCGTDPSCTAAMADPSSITRMVSGSSVEFRYDTTDWPSNRRNVFTFDGASSEVAGTGPEHSFLLGRVTFENGQFYPLVFIDLTLTTHSSDPALDQHTFVGRIRLDTNATPAAHDPEPEADYFTVQDAAGRTLQGLGSVRVYDAFDCPDSTPSGQTCNLGSVDLYGHINSLDLDRFANAQGGAFVNTSTTGSLVPEPGSAWLWILGLAGIAGWHRAKRSGNAGR